MAGASQRFRLGRGVVSVLGLDIVGVMMIFSYDDRVETGLRRETRFPIRQLPALAPRQRKAGEQRESDRGQWHG